MPSPWIDQDLGSVGIAGSAVYSNGTYTVNGSGAVIEGSADAGNYLYQSCLGNCEVRAQVTHLQNTDQWAKVGVMIRESTNAAAVNAMVEMTAGNGVEFQWRTITAGATSSTVTPDLTTPAWVRLVRNANSFSAYYGTDGTNWTQIGTSQTISLAATNAMMGLVVTAHNNTTNCSANFDNVTVNQSPVLAAISNQTIMAGQALTISNSATDADVPAQTLAFSLANAPSNSAINSSSGVFIWRPTIAQSPSTQTASVVVTDSGVPPMSATQNFTVTVARPSPPVLNSASMSKGHPGFRINGDDGPDYTIQTSTKLHSWSSVVTLSSPLTPFVWNDTNLVILPEQFYRIVLGP